MSKIEITQREMERAFRSHYAATQQLPSSVNPSKLVCLFYAVECGLKHLVMKREHHSTTGGIDHYGFEHNINKILNHLRCGKQLRLPANISLYTVSCRLAGIGPYRYMVDILQRISHHPARNIRDLIPRIWKEEIRGQSAEV